MSSKLTSAQIIALGDYLEPDYDPTSLTISQLLGVLGFHNIQYPVPYSKPKLVKTFNEELKTRAAKFKKERLKKENSIASDEGILNGHTGELLNKGKVRTGHLLYLYIHLAFLPGTLGCSSFLTPYITNTSRRR